MSEKVRLRLDLSEQEAEALAEMAKRFTHEDGERFGNPYDQGRERDAILRGVAILREALAKEGFAPR